MNRYLYNFYDRPMVFDTFIDAVAQLLKDTGYDDLLQLVEEEGLRLTPLDIRQLDEYIAIGNPDEGEGISIVRVKKRPSRSNW